MELTVSADLVRDWLDRSRSALANVREEIDALNVYPVPDGDTGTNLFLTVDAATSAVVAVLATGPTTTARAAQEAATGALLGARGNSGVIVAQMLRGVSDVLAELVDGTTLDAVSVGRMLRRAADLAYQAVGRPVEGTILTVARAAADAAEAATADGVGAVVRAAAQGAREALDRTPEQLAELRLAGVVDAGGRGLVVMLDALAGLAAGEPAPAWLRSPDEERTAARRLDARAVGTYRGPAFEVMFLLDASTDSVDRLRARLAELGDSIVVVGGDGLWSVHVHADDAGAVVEAANDAGRPHRVRITHLEPTTSTGARAIVAVARGDGVADVLRSCNAVVVSAVPGRRPSTGEFLDAIVATHAHEVVVLPGDSDTQAAADLAAARARSDGIRVSVIPTRSIVQSLAAMAVHDEEASFDDVVVTMTRAAGATRYAGVTVASRAALTTVGPCEAGDVLGLVDGDIVAVGTDLEVVARDIVTRMLAGGGDLVTLVPGADAGDGLRGDLRAWLGREHPLLDVVEHYGGQPMWPLIVGVE